MCLPSTVNEAGKPALVKPSVARASALGIPVIAAGGIGDAAGVRACGRAGSDGARRLGVQVGTAFLLGSLQKKEKSYAKPRSTRLSLFEALQS
jgi:phosphoribosylformimino-5-aminoimidazole carboxamide ribonucleotide (ProFAR) isomerase